MTNRKWWLLVWALALVFCLLPFAPKADSPYQIVLESHSECSDNLYNNERETCVIIIQTFENGIQSGRIVVCPKDDPDHHIPCHALPLKVL